MATRRRTSRTTRSSSGYRYGYRRRRPGTASTLGGAVALGAIALLTKLSWPQRIGLAVIVLLLVVGYELWTRRGQIAAEIAQQQAAGDGGPTGPPSAQPPPGPPAAS